MIVGFTGTQMGMTAAQAATVERLLTNLEADELHHGDCIGADKQTHDVARTLGMRVVLHPPDNPSKRAFCDADIVREEKPYLVRNENIARETQLLIAAPKEDTEQLRSGTWATVRRAKKHRTPTVAVYPDGSYERMAWEAKSVQWFANALATALVESMARYA